ncbi:MAG: PrsW family intramembrane metalloprotease [Clostridia bacterium]|nr:PrsW family intramembrane metalloprotease [Clostridia bacterium]
MYNGLLVFAALLPAIILCIYVFKKDRVEKEPIGLLIRLLLFGVACCIPAALMEVTFSGVLDALFTDYIFIDSRGIEFISDDVFYLYHFLEYFVGVALIEEGCKWFVLLYATKRNKEFNSLFDGLIYAVFISIGFAAFENIFYVLENGWINAIMRGILSVPGHMFFAVLMGYHYSFWHIADKAGTIERQLKAEGIVQSRTEISGKRQMILSLLMPVLAHGLYDFCCTLDSGIGVLAFYAFIIVLYVYCFGKIKKMSASDAPQERFVLGMLLKKYPFLSTGSLEIADIEKM